MGFLIPFFAFGGFAVSKKNRVLDPTAEKDDPGECFCGQLEKLRRMMTKEGVSSYPGKAAITTKCHCLMIYNSNGFSFCRHNL